MEIYFTSVEDPVVHKVTTNPFLAAIEAAWEEREVEADEEPKHDVPKHCVRFDEQGRVIETRPYSYKE